jgi:hypothetical protein
MQRNNKPPWKKHVPPSQTVMKFVDERGMPFPEEDGADSEEVWENTVEAYVKKRLDRCVYVCVYMCECMCNVCVCMRM